MSSQIIQVQTTFPSSESASACCHGLIELKLAACVQILGPISSTYWFDGDICQDSEWLILIKTKSSHFDALEQYLLDHHPYDVPQIIAIPIQDASSSYLGWIKHVM